MGANETILNFLAAMKAKYDKDEIDLKKLGTQTKIKGASTVRKAIAKLKKNGWITVSGGIVRITDQGMAAADTSSFDDIEIPTTNAEKHASVKADLSANQVRLFDAISDGRSHQKELVRKQLEMPNNSTWRKLLASLKTINVAEYPDKDTIRLTKDMFPIVPRPE
jgi:superfamily II helicase